MLLFAPNANSYRRLRPRPTPRPRRPGAGTTGRWRCASRRAVPAARRIEHRVAGADANPYLVLAAVLAGVLQGLEHRQEPDAPTIGNAYAEVGRACR